MKSLSRFNLCYQILLSTYEEPAVKYIFVLFDKSNTADNGENYVPLSSHMGYNFKLVQF